MARNRQLVRALRLAKEIVGLHCLPPVDELAVRHGVSSRTIRRDLGALEQAGVWLPVDRYDPWVGDRQPRRACGDRASE